MNPVTDIPRGPGDALLRGMLRSTRAQLFVRQMDLLLGPTQGQVCLDIGGESGWASALLRRRGGEWHSVEADERAVASLRHMVGARAYGFDGRRLPFKDESFDCVVIVDFLEHVEDDLAFIQECHRVLKRAGRLVVNAPSERRGSLLRPFRNLFGLTDEWEGHVRRGYTEPRLFEVLKDGFDVQDVRSYSRLLTEMVDVLTRYAGLREAARESGGGAPDAVSFCSAMANAYRRYAIPSWIARQLDVLLFLSRGYRLVVRAKRRLWIPRKTPVLRDGRSIAEATLHARIGTASVLAETKKEAEPAKVVRSRQG